MTGWKKKKGKYFRAGLLGTGILMVAACWQSLDSAGEAPALAQIWEHLQSGVYVKAMKTHIPAMTCSVEEETDQKLFREYVIEKIADILPVYGYAEQMQEYETQVESRITYEMILASEGKEEEQDKKALEAESGLPKKEPEIAKEEQPPQEEVQKDAETPPESQTQAAQSMAALPADPVVQVPMDKLNDFDYLIQNFYQVDKTTTINGSQLNAQALLEKDMRLTKGNENPQILIYHTHSQEGYVDSNGDSTTTVVGVGELLAQLLRDNYGLNVLHHTGEYDVTDRDNAYSYAGPALEQVLAENPSIEVVIDLHRDGVREDIHLVSDVNGKQTAMVMFFNGLSRTTANGDIPYLPNPYLEDNLAFSLQMKLAAEQYFPGFTRGIYLKGYRYNLHYCPKSLLVEVGAQTNTVAEAMNAMEPLAKLLHKVLVPQQ